MCNAREILCRVYPEWINEILRSIRPQNGKAKEGEKKGFYLVDERYMPFAGVQCYAVINSIFSFVAEGRRIGAK